MAKKPGPPLATISPSAFAATVAPASTPPIPVITVPAGGTLVAIVDVGPMAIPYTVSYAGRTLIKALVDRAEPVSLLPGDQVLRWFFGHVVKEWHHTIGVSVNGGAPVVLESRSEENKDQDTSLGTAVVRFGA